MLAARTPVQAIAVLTMRLTVRPKPPKHAGPLLAAATPPHLRIDQLRVRSPTIMRQIPMRAHRGHLESRILQFYAPAHQVKPRLAQGQEWEGCTCGAANTVERDHRYFQQAPG